MNLHGSRRSGYSIPHYGFRPVGGKPFNRGGFGQSLMVGRTARLSQKLAWRTRPSGLRLGRASYCALCGRLFLARLPLQASSEIEHRVLAKQNRPKPPPGPPEHSRTEAPRVDCFPCEGVPSAPSVPNRPAPRRCRRCAKPSLRVFIGPPRQAAVTGLGMTRCD